MAKSNVIIGYFAVLGARFGTFIAPGAGAAYESPLLSRNWIAIEVTSRDAAPILGNPRNFSTVVT